MRGLCICALALLSACAAPPPEAPPTDPPTPPEPLTLGSDRERSWRDDVPPPDQPVIPKADYGRCMRSRVCQMQGMCAPDEEGGCIASSDADCESSDACAIGHCSARDGICVAASPDDCSKSIACEGYGLCGWDGDGDCVARSDADCQASTRCKQSGDCSARDGVCIR